MVPSQILPRLKFVDYTIADPGASGTIVVDRQFGVVPLVTATAESRTLPRPLRTGIEITVYMLTDGGDCTLTVTGGYNEDGDTTFTFDDAGEFAKFQSFYDGTNYYWNKFADHTQNVLTQTEIGFLEDLTAGTGAASKAVVLDSSSNFTWPNSGTLTIGNTATAAEAAEHGAGAIGTAFTPVTYRWIDKGVIITQIKFDLTGLASVATANDVIGLAAGGVAYIGRNVVATNGVIFKTEFSCIETPAGGDNDVNVVLNSSGALAYDGAGGTTYISNSGDLLAGQTVSNLVPAITANDYYYLTAGTGDTAATYTAGMYVLTLYGHALLA